MSKRSKLKEESLPKTTNFDSLGKVNTDDINSLSKRTDFDSLGKVKKDFDSLWNLSLKREHA